MSGRFDGKVAIVTGAATGIGRATGLRLAREGARLVLTTSRNAAGLASTVAEIESGGGIALGIQADAGRDEDAAMTVAESLRVFDRLDVVVANAAYQHPRQPADRLPADEWDQTIAVGLTGVFLAAKHAIPAMLASGGGAIVNVSSVNSVLHAPGLPAYSAAKGGVDALTRQLALEYGPQGIRINAVNPGLVAVESVAAFLEQNPDEELAARESHPLNRYGKPAEVAAAISFLASDDASFITGVTLLVDGGLSIQSAASVLRPGLRQGWRDGQVTILPGTAQ